jgi:hypothetical protein
MKSHNIFLKIQSNKVCRRKGSPKAFLQIYENYCSGFLLSRRGFCVSSLKLNLITFISNGE